MKIASLITLLEQLDPQTPLVVEITKDNEESITTYDIGFDYSELGEFMLKVHA